MKISFPRFAFLVFLILAFLVPAGCPLAAGQPSVRHKVVQGDCIRSLLLGSNCVTSMSQYFSVREAFAGLNPGVFHSALLVPGTEVSVPVLFKSAAGCLAFREQRIVRIEFEGGGAVEKVLVYLDGPVLPDVFTLKQTQPVRVVCDFDGVLPEAGLQREIDTPGRMVRKLRVGHEDKPFKRARVVLEVDDTLAGRITQEFFEQESLFVLTVHELERN